MRISIIGAGRVAYHLIQAFKQQHEIIEIYSRTFAQAEQLANLCQAVAVHEIQQLSVDVDVVLIAVSDQSIASVAKALADQRPDVLIAHTSGSTDLNVLQQHHARAGVFYPLQTFSLEREVDWQNTPIFVEAALPRDTECLQMLARSLTNRVYEYSSAQRLSLHLAAVFACNFSNYCYDMAKQVVDAQQVDFSLLYPLITATAQKILHADPKVMQTGPAMRGDENIIAMHQKILEQENRTDLQQVYALLSQQILQRHQ